MGSQDSCFNFDSVRRDLEQLSLQLRSVHAAAVATQLALRAQQAEQDVEIADTLRAAVVDVLSERISALDRCVHRLQRMQVNS